MKVFIVCLLVLTISSCCKKIDPITYCNLENPLIELSVLKNIVEQSQNDGTEIIIKHNKYTNLEYIVVNNIAENKSEIYDCSGNKLCTAIENDSEECNEVLQNVGDFIEFTILY